MNKDKIIQDIVDLMYDNMDLDGLDFMETAEDIHKLYDNQWISVEDRLPEEYVQVIIYPPKKGDDGTANENIGYLSKRGTFEYSNDYTIFKHRDITHWMPLPNPPQEKEE